MIRTQLFRFPSTLPQIMSKIKCIYNYIHKGVKKLLLVCLLLSVSLGARCAQKVHKDWFAHDGSRSDAIVKLAITWNPAMEIPQADRGQADALAAAKCRVWGYTGAEPFGSIVQRCTQMGHNGYSVVCYQMQAEVTYQCLGNPGQNQPEPVGKSIKP